jgi:hypothetical protein
MQQRPCTTTSTSCGQHRSPTCGHFEQAQQHDTTALFTPAATRVCHVVMQTPRCLPSVAVPAVRSCMPLHHEGLPLGSVATSPQPCLCQHTPMHIARRTAPHPSHCSHVSQGDPLWLCRPMLVGIIHVRAHQEHIMAGMQAVPACVLQHWGAACMPRSWGRTHYSVPKQAIQNPNPASRDG